jgi:hypothetical protein
MTISCKTCGHEYPTKEELADSVEWLIRHPNVYTRAETLTMAAAMLRDPDFINRLTGVKP